MTVMLPYETPRIETRFKSPLLSASTRITRQSAANAIRRWWNIGSDRERADLGMVISRSDIINRNNEIGNAIPVALLTSPGPDGHEVILAAFSAQSAVALRARAPGSWAGPTRKGDPSDLFTVFPVVLRLTSMARPKDAGFLPLDGLGDITLKMQGTKSPILALAREKGEGGWVNAEASWTCEIEGLDEARRAAQIDIDIVAAQPRQRPGQDAPKVKISLRGDDVLRDGAAAKKRLTNCAMRILRAGEAPLPLERMVGQVERDYRNRRTWVEGVTLASRLASSDVSLSNHEIMQLRQKFDPYWD